MTSSNVTLLDEVDKIIYDVRPSLMVNFKLDHANTCDSVQGMSFDQPITILDSNIPYCDRKFIWTALTRCRKLSDVTFYIHNKDEIKRYTINRFNLYFKLKINGYKQQDNNKNRKFTDDEYITDKWIVEKLEECDYNCPHCNIKLKLDLDDMTSNVTSNITVDRKDNKLSHITSNCQILCLHCNVSKK
jgi:hypothetical protein